MRLSSDSDPFGWRLLASKIAVCLAFFLLTTRILYLQGVQGSYYRDLSENNRRRAIRSEAPRGSIYDREGRLLVRNRPAFNVAILREDVSDIGSTLNNLAKISGSSVEELQASLDDRRRARPFEPQVLIRDVDRSVLAKVKANAFRLPGVIVTTAATRAYPEPTIAAPIYGYTREISRDQLSKLRPAGYKMGDSVGQTGVEKTFEAHLRGNAGFTQIEVDARGNKKRELGIIDAEAGNDLFLTIDKDLQSAAEKALKGKKGAMVALDPQTGEVLTLVTAPSFDADLFSGQLRSEDWQKLVNDPEKPLTNRAISNIYPPGSTLKLLYALACLQEKKIAPDTEFFCPGYFSLGRRRYHCHKRSGHGKVDLKKAITVSCNAYFYQLGQLLGIDKYSKYLKMFGFGEKTGISLAGEEAGVRPSKEWKRKRFGEKWYPGDTIPVSIGQGYLAVTPIQLALMSASIANGGKVYKPLLVKKIASNDGLAAETFEPELLGEIDIDPKWFALVQQYASSVVNDLTGTGRRAIIPGVEVAGKTGTAQTRRQSTGGVSIGVDHALFVGFAPVENPMIAFAVIVEYGGHGGSSAAPIATEVLRTFFRKNGMMIEDEEVELQLVKQETAPTRARLATISEDSIQREEIIAPEQYVPESVSEDFSSELETDSPAVSNEGADGQ